MPTPPKLPGGEPAQRGPGGQEVLSLFPAHRGTTLTLKELRVKTIFASRCPHNEVYTSNHPIKSLLNVRDNCRVNLLFNQESLKVEKKMKSNFHQNKQHYTRCEPDEQSGAHHFVIAPLPTHKGDSNGFSHGTKGY